MILVISMSSSGSSGGGGKGDFPINFTARDVGLDRSIAKLQRFSEALKQTGVAVQQSLATINQFGQGLVNFDRSTATMTRE